MAALVFTGLLFLLLLPLVCKVRGDFNITINYSDGSVIYSPPSAWLLGTTVSDSAQTAVAVAKDTSDAVVEGEVPQFSINFNGEHYPVY